jgi:hypothetical protein
MLVNYSKSAGAFYLDLPDECLAYKDELSRVLNEEFGFEPVNRETISAMNSFASNWLAGRKNNS